MARTKIITKITANDCMPFFKEGGKELDFAITENNDNNKIDKDALALRKFVDSIVRISIFGRDLNDEDADSKLAYSPFENKPCIWNENGIEIKKRVWQAGRYVGATQIGDTYIEILPRFGIGWLEYMLLGDVTHFKAVESGSDVNENSHALNDLMRRILWYLWVRKFASADQYGLPKRVVKRTHIGMQIRGHLNVRKSLLPLFTKRQVVSEFREKDIDDAICRIVYKAYCILVNREYNKSQAPSQVQDSLNTLYSYYQGQPISVSANDYNNLSYKSIYMSWKPLVDFSWQIIQQDSLFKRKGSKGDSLSVFLDMAEIWEAFLRKQLGERLEGWRIWSIEECKKKVYEGTFFERKIIPDIVLERNGEDGGKEFLVFDAKYKKMTGDKDDVDRSDFFQIHTYIQYFQNTQGKVILGGLLYPISEDFDTKVFHSDSLFGVNVQEKDNIPFVVDGVYCPYIEEHDLEKAKDVMGLYVQAMIDRILERIQSK